MCACIYAGFTCAGVRVRAYAQNVCDRVQRWVHVCKKRRVARRSSFFSFRFEAHRVLVRPRRSSLLSRYARFLRFVAGYARFWSFYSSGCSWVAVRSPLSASVSSGSWNSERSKVEEKHFEDRIIFQVLNVSSCGLWHKWKYHDSFFHTHQKPPHFGQF